MNFKKLFLNQKRTVVCGVIISVFLGMAMVIAQIDLTRLNPKNMKEHGLVGKSKKVYAIFANDNTSGMTHALFDTAVQEFTVQGHSVDVLNLYDRESEMPFFKHDRANMESHPFYLENKQRFLGADVLLIVFPLYWYSVPGILKTWIDMLSGWSYKYESGQYAQPLHKIKQVVVLYACAQATSPKNSDGLSAVEYQVSETCKFIGIPEVKIHGISGVYGLQPEDTQKHFDAVKTLCRIV